LLQPAVSRPFSSAIVAISDFRDGWPPADSPEPTVAEAHEAWRRGDLGPPPQDPGRPAADVAVVGGYLERLPLACVAAGLADAAEIWHHWRPASPPPFRRDSPVLARRAFRLGSADPPFRSNSMLGFIEAFGAPRILCAWGLGVDAAILDACNASFKIYNSIDAPALRIPPEVSARFDIVLTAAEWQSDEVRARHPDMPCAVLPIGPEFADPLTFRPLGSDKPYDVIYVAAAQPYKRHDILFDALARAPRRLRALCVFGYGEMGDELRRRAAEQGLDVTCIGPPGVDFAEVNRLMNLARIGVVCGVDDGAPAILTEYMLAGLPVLANARLRCGLQYVGPETGQTAEAEDFGAAMVALIDRAPALKPRAAVLERWTWPQSVARLQALMAAAPKAHALGLDRVSPLRL
jgi:glycosyltransferase involved in cell wall biosynthesis